MKDYLKKHWIVILLIFLVWGGVIYIIQSSKKDTEESKRDIERKVVTIQKTDSILQVSDSIIGKVQKMKELHQQKIKQLEKQRREIESEQKRSKYEIFELKKQKSKVKEIVVEKEKIVEKEKVVEKKIFVEKKIHDTVYQRVETVKYIQQQTKPKSKKVDLESMTSMKVDTNKDVDTTSKKTRWFKKLFQKKD
jgi:hypothetical protein